MLASSPLSLLCLRGCGPALVSFRGLAEGISVRDSFVFVYVCARHAACPCRWAPRFEMKVLVPECRLQEGAADHPCVVCLDMYLWHIFWGRGVCLCV